MTGPQAATIGTGGVARGPWRGAFNIRMTTATVPDGSDEPGRTGHAGLRRVAASLAGVGQALGERGDVDRSSILIDCALALAALGEPAAFDHVTLIEALLHVAIPVHR